MIHHFCIRRRYDLNMPLTLSYS